MNPIWPNVVLIPIDEETETPSWLILQHSVSKKARTPIGEVYAVPVDSDFGVKKWDIVFYRTWMSEDFSYEGKDYIVINKNWIIWVKVL